MTPSVPLQSKNAADPAKSPTENAKKPRPFGGTLSPQTAAYLEARKEARDAREAEQFAARLRFAASPAGVARALAEEARTDRLAALVERHRARLAECETEQFDFSDLPNAFRSIGYRADEPESEPIVRPHLTRAGFEAENVQNDLTIDGRIYTEEERRMLSEHYAGKTLYESDLKTKRNWAVYRDTQERVPNLDDPHAVAERYRAGLPGIGTADMGMIVVMREGAQFEFMVWHREPIDGAAARGWITPRPGFGTEDEPRFKYLEQWQPFGVPAMLEPRVNAPRVATLAGLATPRCVTAASNVTAYSTGLDSLDDLFRAGALPAGSRLVIQAPPEHLKTSLAVAIGRALVAAGLDVAHLAVDEADHKIHERLGQHPEGAPDRYFVINAEHYLEDVLDATPDAVVIDSIQTVRTHAGEGKGAIERVNAVIEILRAWGGLAIVTSELARAAYQGTRQRSAITGGKNSGAIEYGATCMLGLKYDRKAGRLRVAVLKNRDGAADPEGSVAFELAPDLAQQTFTPAAAAPSKGAPEHSEPALWGRIRAAVAKGPQSKTWIREHVTGDTNATHATVADMVAAGALVRVGAKLGLP
jgi:KaiC/GvpD/RAD55 family RecA-like ATPase